MEFKLGDRVQAKSGSYREGNIGNVVTVDRDDDGNVLWYNILFDHETGPAVAMAGEDLELVKPSSSKKINSSELADTIKLLESQGASKDDDDSDFDTAQLAAGILVEQEHSSDFTVAKEIAKDHLKEDPNYYGKYFFPGEAKEQLEEGLDPEESDKGSDSSEKVNSEADHRVVVPALAYYKAVGRGCPRFDDYLGWERVNNVFENYSKARKNYDKLCKELEDENDQA